MMLQDLALRTSITVELVAMTDLTAHEISTDLMALLKIGNQVPHYQKVKAVNMPTDSPTMDLDTSSAATIVREPIFQVFGALTQALNFGHL
jgi:hypothetical protein